MSHPRIPVPPGYQEIRLPRTGSRHGDFIGRHQPRSRYLELRSRSDGLLHPLDKAQLLPPGMWELCEQLSAAAAAAGCPPAQLLQRLAIPAAGEDPLSSGHPRPSIPETADAAPEDGPTDV